MCFPSVLMGGSELGLWHIVNNLGVESLAFNI